MTNNPGQELGRKLTVQSFGWNKKSILQAVLAQEGTDVFLMRIVGVAGGLKAYKSTRAKNEDGSPLTGYGVRGVFKITSQANAPEHPNETLNGNLIYLPGYVTDMLVGLLTSGGDDSDVSVECGLDLYARYDEDSATSYIFIAYSLTKIDTTALDALEASLSKTPMPALAGPKK